MYLAVFQQLECNPVTLEDPIYFLAERSSTFGLSETEMIVPKETVEIPLPRFRNLLVCELNDVKSLKRRGQVHAIHEIEEAMHG